MMPTNAVFDPLGGLKFVLMFEALSFLFMAFLTFAWMIALTWSLFHCSKYFPEGEAKTRWILLIVLVPLAGPLAYCFAGRPVCNRKFF